MVVPPKQLPQTEGILMNVYLLFVGFGVLLVALITGGLIYNHLVAVREDLKAAKAREHAYARRTNQVGKHARGASLHATRHVHRTIKASAKRGRRR